MANVSKPENAPQNVSDTSSISSSTDQTITGSIPKRTSLRKVFRKMLLVAIIAILGMYLLSFTAPKPSGLGLNGGQLASLPEKPNCVSTQTGDSTKLMPAISFSCPPEVAMNRMETAVKNYPRTRIVERNDRYLRAEFTSLVFRFVDDVEIFVNDTENVIHFRSASRAGHHDLGVNRRRMTRLIESFENE